jgi:hypothetical protein
MLRSACRLVFSRLILRWSIVFIFLLLFSACHSSRSAISLEFPLQSSAKKICRQDLWLTLPKGLYHVDAIFNNEKKTTESTSLPADIHIVYAVSIKGKGVVCSGSLTPLPQSSQRTGSGDAFEVASEEILHVEFTLPVSPDAEGKECIVRIGSNV